MAGGRELSDTIAFIRKLDRARSPDDVCAMLLEITRRFGVERVLAGLIPMPGADRRTQLSHVVMSAWPEEWSRRYFSHDYLFRDPTIEQVQKAATPFLWSELEPAYRSDFAARRIMEEASEFKLKEGYTIPLVTIEGDVAGFSLAGERLEMSPEERSMLVLVATYALGRALPLRKIPQVPAADLTLREREALQWVAEGLSDCDISEKMGISEHGVDKHMRAARSKLGTVTRAHAVAEALRRNLIR
ncbi:helix-turn-helix transcriptional regulator [Microvirga terricola]|uniref:LuxR family transcriptional regulator n=1 Tax=Microvirga terricola TaxID=2719797 RepID=A0ABX0V620_9HYPH|nr:LuxR family transcriptional regulator [Microvirga terricola]NIX75272.1 LuxR family transcriptional regulator [Microvirga terricola]